MIKIRAQEGTGELYMEFFIYDFMICTGLNDGVSLRDGDVRMIVEEY